MEPRDSPLTLPHRIWNGCDKRTNVLSHLLHLIESLADQSGVSPLPCLDSAVITLPGIELTNNWAKSSPKKYRHVTKISRLVLKIYFTMECRHVFFWKTPNKLTDNNSILSVLPDIKRSYFNSLLKKNYYLE
ncbi:hypothetical protein CDAR_589161 [Caerostris darwini]|uniref:Maturase K n=1 Tax=Caerostris darwini TaxID=1538125 RepID=A0AAV4T782_9ARAC|nr:hypothetical protein CDAR_589161 [Caerostris darwini]